MVQLDKKDDYYIEYITNTNDSININTYNSCVKRNTTTIDIICRTSCFIMTIICIIYIYIFYV